jgi:hypothetical protein
MAEELLNTVSVVSLAYTAITLVVCFVLSRLLGRNVSSVDKLVLWWIIWDALIHMSLEAPFVVISLTGTVNNSASIAALTWKEYGKADARWLYSDPTIVSLEILTAFLLSPICLLLVYAICRQRGYRHWLQLVLCTCELYGGWMTFAPEWLTGSKSLVTDNALYLWCYLVFFNGLWVVIPLALMYQSWIALNNAAGNGKPSARPSAPKSKESTPKSVMREELQSSPTSGGGQARRRKQY